MGKKAKLFSDDSLTIPQSSSGSQANEVLESVPGYWWTSDQAVDNVRPPRRHE